MALRSTLRRFASRLGRWLRRGIDIASGGAASIFGVRPTLSGVQVTDRTALESTAYFAGVRNIAEDLATMPAVLYRRIDERRKERDPNHALYPILHDQPNEESDIVTFVEMMQAWLMIRRNSFAEVVRNGAGGVVSLWPIPPWRIRMRRFEGQLYYHVTLPEGERDPRTGLGESVLDRSRILHLKAFALDGVLGLSSVDLHQESIGLALALDRYGASFFGNDATPGLIYEHPGKLQDDTYQRMKRELEEPHLGLEQKHRLILLEEGMKANPVSIDNDKAQFLASKQHSVEEMARLNRIPPHLIQDLTHGTFSNIEHQSIDYVMYTLRPWAVRWEKAIQTQLLAGSDRRTHFVEFLLDSLMRGDSPTRANVLAIMRQNGALNADEWRAIDNMNPTEDGSGQVYLVNGNMVPVGMVGRAPKPSPTVDPQRLFRPLFRSAAERCIRREVDEVSRAIEKLGSEGAAKFEARVLVAYRQQEDHVRQVWMPLAVAVGEAVRGESGVDVSEWALEYSRTVASARARAAQEHLRAVLAGAPSDARGRLQDLVEGWGREEPERMAAREAREMVDSITRWLGARAA